jgi:superfamily II DNA or RNA helicase
MHFHEAELQTALNPIYLDRGRQYQAQGRVLSTDLQKGGTLLAAMVRGSSQKVYKQIIRIERNRRGALEITGQCSCPVHYNCKHVAAALVEVARQQVGTTLRSAENLALELGVWLARLKAVQQPSQEREPSNRLLYLLDMGAGQAGSFLTVRPFRVRVLPNGEFAKPTPFTRGTHSTAQFLSAEDHELLALLQGCESEGEDAGGRVLRGHMGHRVLDAMIATGRCHWGSPEEPPLRRGPTLASPLTWELERDGTQTVRAEQASATCFLLPLAPPWCFDPDSGDCRPLQCGLPDSIAEALAAAPPVAFDQADTLARALEDTFPDHDLPVPSEPQTRKRDDIVPTPCLRLRSSRDDFFYPHEDAAWEDYAEFWFDYDGLLVHPWDEEPLLAHRRGESVELVLRHAEQEIDHFEHLVSLGLEPDEIIPSEDALPLVQAGGPDDWMGFLLQQAPGLSKEGWRIEVDPSFRFRLVEAGDWYADLDETPGDAWFSLELGVDLDGERVNLLPLLAAYLRHIKTPEDLQRLRELPEEQPLLCPLGDGRVLRLPLGRARRVMDVLAELYDATALDREGRLRLPRQCSAQLPELDSLQWQGGRELRAYGRKLRNFAGIPSVPPPEGLRAQLRPYQREGLNWLQFLREMELGGILADDMGLGKTVQTLAHLLVERAAGRNDLPSLVVAPTSLMVNWQREAERFAPDLRVLVLHGPARKQNFDAIPEQDLVLTTYPLLARDAEALLAARWHLVILDEAQHIKNPKVKAAVTACRLNARHRLCLTGTPLENHLGELWSQFHFLMPGFLGEQKRFRRIFRTPVEKHGDQARSLQLSRRVAPFLLRREKTQVMAELPPKTEIVNQVELTGAQRDLYESIRVALHRKLQKEIDEKGIERSRILILDALLKLRQICCDPRLLKMDTAARVKQSAKLELLDEMLPELVAEGRRILLFSQFTGMLTLIEERLRQHGIDFVKLTGRTRDRATPVDRFQAGEAPLFLISLKAGGTGLNLTAADTVIHYDPWWNPAVERQATDRAHRIGQDKPVFVYKLLARGTVEEKIAEMQQRKQDLADSLFDGRSGATALSPEDLQALFAPL